MRIEQYITNYAHSAYTKSTTAISRFTFYIEEELDIYLPHLVGTSPIICLGYKRIDGGQLYALPTALIQVTALGEVDVIFDTQKQDILAVHRRLDGLFKGTPIASIYEYTLEINTHGKECLSI